jgi:hypothetical protein
MDDILILKYGQLAMQYAREKNPEINQRLIEMEKQLSMSRKEIMIRVKELAIAGLGHH